MKLWRSFLEILQFPLKIVFLGIFLYGLGNIFINPAFSSVFIIKNDILIIVSEILMKIGGFIIVYSPFLYLLRSVNRKVNGAITILSGLIGYVSFLIVTMFMADKSLPSSAFYSMFNLSLANSMSTTLYGTLYPLRTGLIGAFIIIITTRISFSQSRNKTQYGFFSFVDKDLYAVILNIFYSCIAGIVISILYSYFYNSILKIIAFISTDISNPMSLFVYGLIERTLSTFDMANIIKIPFWFQANGGTWANLVGEGVSGDVSVWTNSLLSGQVQLTSGKFITPYYVLNMFAIPSMVWAIFSIYTDKFERRRLFLFFVLVTLVSMFSGTLIPLELLLLLLCPLLYLFHILYSASLFGLFQALNVSLGFNYTGTSTVTAMPGTLLEFLSYLRNPSLSNSIRMVVIVGVISGIIYFVFTIAYFRYLAVDLFKTGRVAYLTKGTIKAIGGLENIKMINTSINRLTIQVFDQTLVDVNLLIKLGATKVTDTKAGLSIQYGSASTIIGKELKKNIRESLRGD